MVETSATDNAGSDRISRFDTVSYLFQMSRELAVIADEHGLARVSAAFDLARTLSAEALADMAVAQRYDGGKLDPDNAA